MHIRCVYDLGKEPVIKYFFKFQHNEVHDQKQKKHGLTFYCRRSVCVQLNKFYIFTLNLDVTKFVICKRKKGDSMLC